MKVEGARQSHADIIYLIVCIVLSLSQWNSDNFNRWYFRRIIKYKDLYKLTQHRHVKIIQIEVFENIFVLKLFKIDHIFKKE